jgi:hypothetical protein
MDLILEIDDAFITERDDLIIENSLKDKVNLHADGWLPTAPACETDAQRCGSHPFSYVRPHIFMASPSF